MKNVTLGCSVVCMDHVNIARDAKFIEDIGFNLLHIDVMDGNYVPRYGIYPEIAARLSETSSLKMDVHLMVRDVNLAITEYAAIPNVEYITIHIEENEKDLMYLIDKIRGFGKKVGIALNLFTDIDKVFGLIDSGEINSVMLMGIHPGVLRQESRPSRVIEKAKKLSSFCLAAPELDMIQCDGGVRFDTIPALARSGVSNFVCGSSTIFKNVSFSDTFEDNKQKIEENNRRLRKLISGMEE